MLTQDEICNLNSKACDYWSRKLLENEEVLTYLRERAVSEESIRKFKLGYAENNKYNLLNYLVKLEGTKNICKDILEAGLGVGSEQDAVDRFRGRLMFPIVIEGGKIAGFTGRTTENTSPKYINSPETLVYKKSRILYGFNFSKPFILHQKYAILIEGNVGLILLDQSGIKNVVATCGTAFTPWMAKRLYCVTNKVITIFDGDEAGEKAQSKAETALKEYGIEVKNVELPAGYDPDDFIREFGRQEFMRLITN